MELDINSLRQGADRKAFEVSLDGSANQIAGIGLESNPSTIDHSIHPTLSM